MAEPARSKLMRGDLRVVADMVAAESRVLDVGCGDGALLHFLVHAKGVDGRGVELSHDGVLASVARGLAVIQGDADADLDGYPDDAFDYCILSQTIQATRAPRDVLANLLRIGRRAIVSLPNFGYWRMRWRLLTQGRMPVTATLPHSWYDTPNIHFCTIRDFTALCRELDARIERAAAFRRGGRLRGFDATSARANLLCDEAVFLLARGGG